MNESKGRVTVPTDADIIGETLRVMERWGADAVRDCDGTSLPQEIKRVAKKVYTTFFPTRGDQEWARAHREQLQQMYLMTDFVTAAEPTLEIPVLDGYFREQVEVDTRHDPKQWWEVMDRTTGETVCPDEWDYDGQKCSVMLMDAVPFHQYTVSFLVYLIWDPTQMYNHITNQWGDRLHEMPYDVRHDETREHIFAVLEQWLRDNPDTDVVRFTTFFYHFTLVFNPLAKEKFVDWFGYGASVSPAAMEAFEAEKGYALRPEDFVDEGYYNSAFRVPSRPYLDYLDFLSRFVCGLVKQCVERTHEAGKDAMMFLGDNWIGTEPYGDYFGETGMDAVVGSVGSGATLRMISEIPHVKYTEGRFLPYFFPDVFREGGRPIEEARENWLTARRALMRKPVDRIGYGGYLKLAVKAPGFVEYIGGVCDEFRTIYDNIGRTEPYQAPFAVAVLNCWGRLRSWSAHMVAHGLWYKQAYSYLGVLEALSGLPFEVRFVSFDDIREQPGLLRDVGVVVNAGGAGTAFSGGDFWLDETVLCELRRFVHEGGGFIGVGEPSAVEWNGRFFQLSDVLGVEKERGFSLSTRKYNTEAKPHFITEDVNGPINFGEGMKDVYALDTAQVLSQQGGDVQLAVNAFGRGRGVYISGLPYDAQNARLLLRSVYWAASREEEMKRWFSSHPDTACHAYPQTGKYAVVNNCGRPVETQVFCTPAQSVSMKLEPCEIRWLAMESQEGCQTS